MNKYMNIKRIEFSITNSCTSHCKHCSRGDVLNSDANRIDKTDSLCIHKDNAISVVKELSKTYQIESIMTFGGEPLLFADTACSIHKVAMEHGIPKRQIITNGYFSKEEDKINHVAKELKTCGINSLLLSIDAFHKEHISLESVYPFAKALCKENIEGFMLHPAWVVNRNHDNIYNSETEKCLEYFSTLQIPVSSGNDIFPAGNAILYLSEFYEKKPIDLNIKCGEAPYTDKLDNIDTIAINPNGDVILCCFVIGNIYRNSITQIINQYNPYNYPCMTALLNGGVGELIHLAEKNGLTIDTSQFYSTCSVCREIVKNLNHLESNK